jgi:spore coat polysaccharide biosynthesis predicted glycosyltransferase SpsG
MNFLNILKNKKVLFFVDTDLENGLGHLQRCLRLSIIFSNFKKIIVSNKIIKLKNFEFLNFDDFLNNNNAYDFGIIDNYNIDYSIEKQIKKKINNLITINDLINRRFASDFIINYDPLATVKMYKNKIKKNTKLLIGENFNFFNNTKLNKSKINQKKIKLLIYLGQKNRSKEIIQLLRLIKHKGIKDIFILSKFRFSYQNFNLKFRFFNNYKQTQNFMKNFDIVIISAGTIIYEALALNKLIFAKCVSFNQKINFKFLTKNKFVENADALINLKKIIGLFNKSPSNNFYKNYSVLEKLKTIFFGLKNKYQYHISLLDYNEKDLIPLYKMQTLENRKFFKNSDKFSFSHHKQYIDEFVKKKSNYILTINKNFNEVIGYIKFEQSKKKMFISIMLKNEYQKQSIAKNVLGFINSKKFSPEIFYAEIKKKNINSLNAFTKAGFIKDKNLKII